MSTPTSRPTGRPHRRTAAAALALLAGLTLAGCSDDAEPDKGSRPVDTAASATGSGTGSGAASDAASGTSSAAPATSEVELLSAGTGPRRVIELDVEDGHTEETTVELETTTEIGLPEPLTIPVTMPFSTTVTGSDDDGVTADVVYGKASVDIAGLPAAAEPMLRQALALVEGTTARVDYARNGTLRSSELELGAEAPDLVARLLDNIASQGFALAVPFPDEEVGVGARWRVVTTTDVGGQIATGTTVTSTYDLTELDASGYTVTVTSEHETEPGDTVAGKVLGGSSTASGTITGRTGFVAPVRVESELSGASTVEVGGQRVESSYSVLMDLVTR